MASEVKVQTRWAKWVAPCGVCALAVLTLAFYFTGWDLAITGAFYDASLPAGSRFFLADKQPWDWLYEYDEVFHATYLVVVVSLLVLGFTSQERRLLLRYAGFLFLAYALGPGLVVNFIFKGFYGRPRPRDTIPFNPSSSTRFYRVWEPAFLDGLDGASFPSGHPTGPLIFFAVFLAFNHPKALSRLLGAGRRAVAAFNAIKWAALAESLVVGLLMGVARIVQGAHFASDVLWSFGFVFSISAALYYLAYKFPRWELERLGKVQT